jgi:hypothetical protein
MIPNANKTKAMFISTSNNIYNTISNSSDFQITLQDESLQFSETEKLLGVHVDHTLNWKTQVKMTLNKCNSLLYLLLRIKQFLNVHVRKIFFNEYILPHLDYCCTIWGNCSKELLNDLYKFQKRAARIILDKDFDAPPNDLFSELNWMQFSERVNYKKVILVYKSLNNLLPDYMQNLFYLHRKYTFKII